MPHGGGQKRVPTKDRQKKEKEDDFINKVLYMPGCGLIRHLDLFFSCR